MSGAKIFLVGEPMSPSILSLWPPLCTCAHTQTHTHTHTHTHAHTHTTQEPYTSLRTWERNVITDPQSPSTASCLGCTVGRQWPPTHSLESDRLALELPRKPYVHWLQSQLRFPPGHMVQYMFLHRQAWMWKSFFKNLDPQIYIFIHSCGTFYWEGDILWIIAELSPSGRQASNRKSTTDGISSHPFLSTSHTPGHCLT